MDTELQPIYNGFYDFARLREGGYIYVDKTRYLHRMITDRNGGLYFLARPRRFGKSLMISTLMAIFQGRREPFDGLYIATQTDYDWPVVPTLHLDMSDVNGRTPEAFEASLYDNTRAALNRAGLDLPEGRHSSAADLLGDGIEKLHRQGLVAVLVDEYDASVGRVLHYPVFAGQVREILQTYYTKLKSKSTLMRFMLMTGVAKFARLSVFSTLNSPSDITLNPDYAAVLGYTEEELDTYFSAYMAKHAEVMGKTQAVYREELRQWFNGYRFSKSPVAVYNPYSIATAFTEMDDEFGSSWTQSGRPSMLMNGLKRCQVSDLEPLFGDAISASTTLLGNTTDLGNLSPLTMLYQTGYLTICGIEPVTRNYMLKIPDEEIRRDLYGLYVDMAAGKTNSQWREELVRFLIYDNPQAFVDGLKDVYATLTYGANEPDCRIPEYSYQRILHGMLVASKIPCAAEKQQSNRSRSDVIADLPTVVYIFELKVGGTAVTADVALQQIYDREYAKPYLHSGKKIYAIGLAFDADSYELKEGRIEAIRSVNSEQSAVNSEQ